MYYADRNQTLQKKKASPWVMSDFCAPWKIADLSSSVSTAGLLLSVLWTNGKEKKVSVGWWGQGCWNVIYLTFELIEHFKNSRFGVETCFPMKSLLFHNPQEWHTFERFYGLSLELNYLFYGSSKETYILPSAFLMKWI